MLWPDRANMQSGLRMQGGLAISMYERIHPAMLVNFNKSHFCLKCLLLLLTATPILIEKEKKKTSHIYLFEIMPVPHCLGSFSCLCFQAFHTSDKWETFHNLGRANVPARKHWQGECHPHDCLWDVDSHGCLLRKRPSVLSLLKSCHWGWAAQLLS